MDETDVVQKKKLVTSNTKIDGLEALILLEQQEELSVEKLCDVNSGEKSIEEDLTKCKNKCTSESDVKCVSKTKKNLSDTLVGLCCENDPKICETASSKVCCIGDNLKSSVEMLNVQKPIVDKATDPSNSTYFHLDSKLNDCQHQLNDKIDRNNLSDVRVNVPQLNSEYTECSNPKTNIDHGVDNKNKFLAKKKESEILNQKISDCAQAVFENESSKGTDASTNHSNEVLPTHCKKLQIVLDKMVNNDKALLQSVNKCKGETSAGEKLIAIKDKIINLNEDATIPEELAQKGLSEKFCDIDSYDSATVISCPTRNQRNNVMCIDSSNNLMHPSKKATDPEQNSVETVCTKNKISTSSQKCHYSQETNIDSLEKSILPLIIEESNDLSSNKTSISNIDCDPKNSVSSLMSKTENNHLCEKEQAQVEGRSELSKKQPIAFLQADKHGKDVEDTVSIKNIVNESICEIPSKDKDPIMLSNGADLCKNRRCLVSLKRLSEGNSFKECKNGHIEEDITINPKNLEVLCNSPITKELSLLLVDQDMITNKHGNLQDRNANTLAVMKDRFNETPSYDPQQNLSSECDLQPHKDKDHGNVEETTFDMAIENLMTELGDMTAASNIEETSQNADSSKILPDTADNTELSAGRRRTIAKPSSEGEFLDMCCEHWFPNNKAYLNHLMSSSTEEIEKLHKGLLDELDMGQCSACNKWLKKSTMRGHLRKIHKITFTTDRLDGTTVKVKPVVVRPIIQSVCSLKKSSDEDFKPCPMSKKKASDPTMILCHLTANKCLTVSSVSDLPFNLKPIVVIEKSLSPYKRKSGFNCVPRIVKVESLSSKRNNLDSITDTQANKSHRKKGRVKEHGVRSEKVKVFESHDDSVRPNKANLKLQNKSSKFSHSEPANTKSVSEKMVTPILRGKFCFGKSGTKSVSKSDAKNSSKSSIKKKTNLPKSFHLSNGYYLQDSSDSHVSDSSSEEEEETSEQINKKSSDGIPTVELDLFTLPSVDGDSSVFLTDPCNPDFKVFASMDAIFVGDSRLAEPSSQLGYVTDTNNVVFINPEHFLFPNMEDSNINLDSLNLSPEDLALLSSFDSKNNNSPSKVILSKNLSPLKNDLTKKMIQSSPKVKLNILRSPQKMTLNEKQNSPAKRPVQENNTLSVTVSKEENVNMKPRNNTLQSKMKIDPIKKALGLVNKHRLVNDFLECKKSKVQIENFSNSGQNSDEESTLEEFFIDSDNISIIDPPESNISKDDITSFTINEATQKELLVPVVTVDSTSDRREPIVIKVGKSAPLVDPDKKYRITVHDSINKSLLKQYPRYWGKCKPVKYISPHLKGNFNYKPKLDTFQRNFAKSSTETNNLKLQPKFKRVSSSLLDGNETANRHCNSYKKPVPIPNTVLSTDVENCALLDTINIDPNSEIVDLPIDLLGNESIVDPEVESTQAKPISSDISPVKRKSLSMEDELKSKVDDYVYIDECGILRSPSGRDINKDSKELSEEAMLINMIENYAEALQVPSEPAALPVNFDMKIKENKQKEKYLDLLKGKSAWDTQLLLSPGKKKVRNDSSTDTASDSDKTFGDYTPNNKRQKRIQSDSNLFNIPFSDIPDLLSPAKCNSHEQNTFLINSPVALSPNTLSAVLSPSEGNTPKQKPVKRTPDVKKTKKSPTPLKKYPSKSNNKLAMVTSSKQLFITPVKIKKKRPSSLGYSPKKEKVNVTKLACSIIPKHSPAKPPITKKKRKPRKKSVRIIQEHYDSDDADFSGFEDGNLPDRIVNNLHGYINSTKSRSRSKGIKLKLSLKNPDLPVVCTEESSTKTAFSPPKSRKRKFEDSVSDADFGSPLNTKYEPITFDKPLQALVLKNFKKSPIKKQSDSKNSIHSVSPLNSITETYKNKKHKRQLNIRPIKELLADPEKGTFALLDNSNENSLNIHNNGPSSLENVKKTSLTSADIKRKHSKEGNPTDIRSYFSPTNSTKVSEKNTFEGFVNKVYEKPRKRRKLNVCPVKPKNSSDIRNYLSKTPVALQSTKDRVAFLEKSYKRFDKMDEQCYWSRVPRDFNGFTSSLPEGAAKLRTLQTYVDVLNMQKMFSTNDYSLPLDVTCEWDEETINQELELV